MIIDKVDIGQTIAKHMNQPKRWLEWVKRESVSMDDVLKWATEEDISETIRRLKVRAK